VTLWPRPANTGGEAPRRLLEGRPSPAQAHGGCGCTAHSMTRADPQESDSPLGSDLLAPASRGELETGTVKARPLRSRSSRRRTAATPAAVSASTRVSSRATEQRLVVSRPFARRDTTKKRLAHREPMLLIDLDDHEAVVFFDNPRSNSAAGHMPGSDRTAFRSVVGAVLLLPGHVDNGIAVGGTAAAVLPALVRGCSRRLRTCRRSIRCLRLHLR
jgi:hypothetical protein